MSKAIRFADEDALRVVLMSGLCPAALATKPVHVAHGTEGELFVAPGKVPRDATKMMSMFGLKLEAKLPEDAREVSCWAEAIACKRVPVGQTPSTVVFMTPDETTLVKLSAELLRLGCERQELLLTSQGGILRAVDAPTYSVLGAIERNDGLRVFATGDQDPDGILTELGYRHPLVTRLKAEPGHFLLIGPERWRSLPDQGWRGLEAALDLVLPGESVELETREVERRRVPLRLAPGRREAPNLWVMRRNGIETIDHLLSYLPDEVIGRLLFAASPLRDGEPPTIVLRVRSSRHAPPDLSLDVESYAPVPGHNDIYAPAGCVVEPPLRRDRLRRIVEIQPDEIAWLAPVGATGETNRGPFRVERMLDSDFKPLAEWADYVITVAGERLESWERAAVFDFASYVSTGVEWAEAPAAPVAVKRPKKAPKVRGAKEAPPTPPPPEPARTVEPDSEVELEPLRVTPVMTDAELAELERKFVAMDAPADDPERIVLLTQLAVTYTRLGRRREAGLCFARTAWETSGLESDSHLDTWIAADLGRTPVAEALATTMALKAPTQDDVRRVAALAARAGDQVRGNSQRVQRWLDAHDREMDSRTLWLARVGLARAVGGDALGLATARDRILERLAAGLQVDRELPGFIRQAGRAGGAGTASADVIVNALENLVHRVMTTKRRKSQTETRWDLTSAYVSLQFANGFARVGQHERARVLAAGAKTTLTAEATKLEGSGSKDGGSMHRYLLGAFEARIEQAIAGDAVEAPLPQELGAQLEKLSRVFRYKADRMRELSRILEPVERLDAIGAFSKRERDVRGPEFAALRAVTDPAQRARDLRTLIDSVPTKDHVDQVRLLDGSLDVMLTLPEAMATPLLSVALPPIDRVPESKRAELYAKAVVVAGHFGRSELIADLLRLLGSALAAAPKNQEETNAKRKTIERVLDLSLRTLRRMGLHRELGELLARAEAALAESSTHAAICARLTLAGGLAFLGELDKAQATFRQARARFVEEPNMPMVTRVELVRALALAYSHTPLEFALAGITDLMQLFGNISDSFGTNGEFCVSVLHFTESIVLGVTSDDLAIGEVTRRFVDDDEYLIRRRLHRDLESGGR